MTSDTPTKPQKGADAFKTGVMVALYPSPDKAKELALKDGETADSLHVTLAYMGKRGEEGVQDDDNWPELFNAAADTAKNHGPLDANIGGLARFIPGENGIPFVGIVGAHGLHELQQELVSRLKDNGVTASDKFPFQPHVTLKYLENGEKDPMALDEPYNLGKFDRIVVKNGERTREFPLEGKPKKTAAIEYPDFLGDYEPPPHEDDHKELDENRAWDYPLYGHNVSRMWWHLRDYHDMENDPRIGTGGHMGDEFDNADDVMRIFRYHHNNEGTPTGSMTVHKTASKSRTGWFIINTETSLPSFAPCSSRDAAQAVFDQYGTIFHHIEERETDEPYYDDPRNLKTNPHRSKTAHYPDESEEDHFNEQGEHSHHTMTDDGNGWDPDDDDAFIKEDEHGFSLGHNWHNVSPWIDCKRCGNRGSEPDPRFEPDSDDAPNCKDCDGQGEIELEHHDDRYSEKIHKELEDEMNKQGYSPNIWHVRGEGSSQEVHMCDHWKPTNDPRYEGRKFVAGTFEDAHQADYEDCGTLGGISYQKASCSCGWETNIRSQAASEAAWQRHFNGLNEERRRDMAGEPREDAFEPKPTKRWGPFEGSWDRYWGKCTCGHTIDEHLTSGAPYYTPYSCEGAGWTKDAGGVGYGDPRYDSEDPMAEPTQSPNCKCTEFDGEAQDEYGNAKYARTHEKGSWAQCDDGHTHWGERGAAGILYRYQEPGSNGAKFLLQKRGPGVQEPGTWGIPGGAIDKKDNGKLESPEAAAEREVTEEFGYLPQVAQGAAFTDDHGGWAYHTFISDVDHPFYVPANGYDHGGTRWFTSDEMTRGEFPIHPGLKSWITKMKRRPDDPRGAIASDKMGHGQARTAQSPRFSAGRYAVLARARDSAVAGSLHGGGSVPGVLSGSAGPGIDVGSEDAGPLAYSDQWDLDKCIWNVHRKHQDDPRGPAFICEKPPVAWIASRELYPGRSISTWYPLCEAHATEKQIGKWKGQVTRVRPRETDRPRVAHQEGDPRVDPWDMDQFGGKVETVEDKRRVWQWMQDHLVEHHGVDRAAIPAEVPNSQGHPNLGTQLWNAYLLNHRFDPFGFKNPTSDRYKGTPVNFTGFEAAIQSEFDPRGQTCENCGSELYWHDPWWLHSSTQSIDCSDHETESKPVRHGARARPFGRNYGPGFTPQSIRDVVNPGDETNPRITCEQCGGMATKHLVDWKRKDDTFTCDNCTLLFMDPRGLPNPYASWIDQVTSPVDPEALPDEPVDESPRLPPLYEGGYSVWPDDHDAERPNRAPQDVLYGPKTGNSVQDYTDALNNRMREPIGTLWHCPNCGKAAGPREPGDPRYTLRQTKYRYCEDCDTECSWCGYINNDKDLEEKFLGHEKGGPRHGEPDWENYNPSCLVCGSSLSD